MAGYRAFLARAFTWVATRGTGQLIDLGCGFPAMPGVSQSAQLVRAGTRVAYVDKRPGRDRARPGGCLRMAGSPWSRWTSAETDDGPALPAG
jgi:hypothetical protein